MPTDPSAIRAPRGAFLAQRATTDIAGHCVCVGGWGAQVKTAMEAELKGLRERVEAMGSEMEGQQHALLKASAIEKEAELIKRQLEDAQARISICMMIMSIRTRMSMSIRMRMSISISISMSISNTYDVTQADACACRTLMRRRARRRRRRSSR